MASPRYEPKISLGNILTAVPMIALCGVMYADLRGDVRAQATKNVEQDAAIAQTEAEIKAERAARSSVERDVAVLVTQLSSVSSNLERAFSELAATNALIRSYFDQRREGGQ
jgi:septal ring factor EnvC (AmiA/AmiB activator)